MTTNHRPLVFELFPNGNADHALKLLKLPVYLDKGGVIYRKEGDAILHTNGKPSRLVVYKPVEGPEQLKLFPYKE